MKRILFILLLMFSVNIIAQNFQKYVGKIGSFPITLFIKQRVFNSDAGFPQGWIWDGYYYYNKVKQRINLKGSFDSMGIGGIDAESYTIYEETNENITGEFQSADFPDLPNRIEGIWVNADQSKKYKFYLIRQ